IDGGQGFDGNDDYIDAGNASTLDVVTGDFTLEAWAKIDDKSGDRDVISKACDGVTLRAFELRYDVGEDCWIFNAYDSAWQYAKYTQANPEVGKWYHLVAVRDGSTIKIYVDGIEGAVTDTLNSMDDSSAFNLLIGRLVDPSDTRYFYGNIDEVRVSSTVRSSDWIATEYNNQHDPTSFYSVTSEEFYPYWWADASFLKRKDIAIDPNQFGSVETDQLEDFPFLLELHDASLKTSVQSDGDDILFIDEEGRKLNHEIELFDQTGNGTHAHLVAWVRIPYLNLKDWTIISMYYSNSELASQANPEGVWTDDYVAVWHLKESGDGTAGEFKDSTSNNNYGQGGGNAGINPPAYPPSQITGQIGYSQEFNESTQEHIEIPISTSLLAPSNSITIEGWVNAFISGLDGGIIFSNWGYGLNFLNGEILGHLNGTVNNVTSWVWWPSDEYTSLGWHHYALIYDGSFERLFIDGIQVAICECTGTIAIGDPDPNTIRIGSNPTWGTPEATGYVNGQIDEVHISSLAKTADWIKVEYENQNDPDSLYSIGAELAFDEVPPQINDFGVDDQGAGVGKFWVDISDGSGVQSVELTVNNTKYTMTDNGTHWVYELAVSYLDYYEYLITNASDIFGNYRQTNSSLKNYSFTKDTVAPNVLQWAYITENNTFQANVTDSWGEIDTVTVNVTTHNLNATMVYYKTIGSSTLAYMNDTISMPNGPIDFQIIVNDTGGNEFISTTHSGTVYDNHPPVASDLTLSRNPSTVLLPVFSNCTLYLDYTYSDQDGHGEDGTEIRWYKHNGTGFELQPARNDTLSIPTSELIKGDQWYATVKPKDGELFGEINQTATITIQNTPPQVSSVVVSPSNPVTTQSLSVSNTTADDDGDSITAYQIRWYNPSYNLTYDNQATIPSSETMKGETWWCELRVFDGTNYSSWITSNSVAIENSAPSASNLAIIPSDTRTADTLTADYDFTDADNDPESGSVIRWYKNGVLQGALNDSLTVDSGNTTKGDTWYFKITPSDGTD
ncbi:MAG: DUF2341 domain-containing protein, partial [Candidatus Hodarchaeales archaeon]